MITHETDTHVIGFIEVPSDAKDFKIEETDYSYYSDMDGSFSKPNKFYHSLPIKGNWRIVALSNQVTEEQAGEFMPKHAVYSEKYWDYVNDYTHSNETATEAFNSLKVSLGVVDVNPYGDKPKFLYEFGEDGPTDSQLESAQDDFDFNSIKWHQSQQQLKNYLIIIKNK